MSQRLKVDKLLALTWAEIDAKHWFICVYIVKGIIVT